MLGARKFSEFIKFAYGVGGCGMFQTSGTEQPENQVPVEDNSSDCRVQFVDLLLGLVENVQLIISESHLQINLTLGNFSFPQALRLGDWRSKNALINDEINLEDQHHYQSEKRFFRIKYKRKRKIFIVKL